MGQRAVYSVTGGPLGLQTATADRHVQQAKADFEPIPFDAAAARAFGLVASSLRRSGGKPASRALDALIAATAIANGLPLYTCNPGDFAEIDDLVVRAVSVPGGPQ